MAAKKQLRRVTRKRREKKLVERGAAHIRHNVKISVRAEIVPKPQRYGGKKKSAVSAAVVFHGCITGRVGCVHNENLLDIAVLF